MALDIIAYLQPLTIFLISIGIFLAIFIGILVIIQKNFHKKIEVKKIQRESELILKNKVNEIRNSKKIPKEKLLSLNFLAKKFFSETFKLKRGLDYTEIAHFFNQKRKKTIVSFCGSMIELLYSGKEISEEDINLISNKLEMIIQAEIKPQIILEKEKPKITKEEKTKFLISNIFKHKPKLQQDENETKEVYKSKLPDITEITLKKPEVSVKKPESYTIKHEKPYPKKIILNENEYHNFIQSIDDLERIKNRIKSLSEAKKP